MTVNATGSATSATQYTSTINNTLGKDEFLKLLITQLRYQDANNPMEDKEFISQMAQFSSLEQMQNLNNSFKEGFQALTYQLYMNSMNEGLNLLGKDVTYLDDNSEAQSGIVEALKQQDGKYYSAVVNGMAVELERISLIKK